jgi:Family of unknown function (DUF6314)
VTGSTLAFLRGSWRLDREVADHESGQHGWFRGRAVFGAEADDPDPAPYVPAGADPAGALVYHEQGELRFGQHRGPASRRLLLLPGLDGAAEVLFADRRPFYQLDLRSGYWQAEHPCGRDRYLVTVRVLGPDDFTEHWRACGPGKDYEMTATLTRTGTGARA